MQEGPRGARAPLQRGRHWRPAVRGGVARVREDGRGVRTDREGVRVQVIIDDHEESLRASGQEGRRGAFAVLRI